MNRSGPVTLAMTGASGAAYGLRLLESLIRAERRVYLMISQAGQIVLNMETDLQIPSDPVGLERALRERYSAAEGQLQVFGRQQWTAPVASGSNAPEAMVVCPCTTGTLSAIACGASNDLIERAADVMIKERRRLILVVRETPLSEIHLENMLRLARHGAVIMPAAPGFYFAPRNLDDLVDFMVARVLDQLHIDHDLTPRWGASSSSD
ncbi:MAG TPA: UbiX family flavin prenyltransferase [Chromatiales bacterium]|nr:UbiX family flavin prenyltransferase [Chromatiales bacterium]